MPVGIVVSACPAAGAIGRNVRQPADGGGGGEEWSGELWPAVADACRRRVARRRRWIAPATGCRYPERVSWFRHTLGSLVGALLCLMALAATAGPVEAHTVSHWLTPVAAGEHHHHDDDGAVIVDHHEQHEDADNDGGHDHMTPAATVMTPPVESAFAAMPFAPGEAVLPFGDSAPRGLRPPPDPRPPRTI